VPDQRLPATGRTAAVRNTHDEAMQDAVQTVKWGGMTVKSFAARFNLS